jgi:hypothetical protein
MKNSLYILFLFISLIGCVKSKKKDHDFHPFYQEKNAKIFTDSLTLSEYGQIDLAIDSVTPQSFNQIQEFEHHGIEYISFLNYFNGHLYIYDLNSNHMANKIDLPGEVNSNTKIVFEKMGHFIKSPDSIFVLDEWNSILYLLDSKGKVVNLMDVSLKSPNIPRASLLANTEKPMDFYDNKLFVSGNLISYGIKDHTKLDNAYSVDISSKKIVPLITRPDIYNKATWAGHQFEVYSALNKEKGSIIYSFSADPFLYERILATGKIFKYYSGSKYFTSIKPFGEAEIFDNENADIPALERHDYINPQYSKLIYDKFHKVYYRFAFLPLTIEQYGSPNRQELRKETIIILDEQFSKKGEFLLPNDNYSRKMTFLDSRGLQIALLPKKQQNPDQITFKTFKLIAK